jgi:hypothetical protein
MVAGPGFDGVYSEGAPVSSWDSVVIDIGIPSSNNRTKYE